MGADDRVIRFGDPTFVDAFLPRAFRVMDMNGVLLHADGELAFGAFDGEGALHLPFFVKVDGHKLLAEFGDPRGQIQRFDLAFLHRADDVSRGGPERQNAKKKEIEKMLQEEVLFLGDLGLDGFFGHTERFKLLFSYSSLA